MFTLALTLAVAPQLPQRVYQPKLVDPGLHGGLPAFEVVPDGNIVPSRVNPGDVTVDGRIAVLYRMAVDPNPPAGANKIRPALQVALFDPAGLEVSGGSLSGYFEPEADGMLPGTSKKKYGTSYAIQDVVVASEPIFSPEEGSGTPQCGSCPPLDENNLPNTGSTRPLAITLKPGVSSNDWLNPYPSNADGGFNEDGEFLTYDLWMVTPHYPVPPEAIDCAEDPGTTSWLCVNGVWVGKGNGLTEPAVLGARDLTVTITNGGGSETIEEVTLGDLELLATTGGAPVRGIEPSLTADGRLLLFNGDGTGNSGASSEISYVYNPTPCSTTGWALPKPITAAVDEDATFKEHYPLARQPIREPLHATDSTSFTDDFEYDADDDLHGAYPWVSKDGSFFMATHVHSQEGTSGQLRSAMMACGDITSGYIKNVDDRALNPTRHGAKTAWPIVDGDASVGFVYDEDSDTQMTTFFSTGLEPGPWQPFPGENHPVPATDADSRIPVLPVFVHRTRMYGDVRFEEADGNFILYLACNEAFHRNDTIEFPSLIDAARTPDTSGQPNRPSCVLRAGASFPKDIMSAFPEQLARRIFIKSGESHENIGFKGQGILFATGGSVDVEFLPAYDQALTLQAFVKPVEDWSNQDLPILTEPGRFQLRLRSDGRIEVELNVEITVDTPSGPVQSLGTKTLTSLYAINPSSSPEVYDPGEGWIHVAAVFDGDEDGQSTLRLYLDGAVYETGGQYDLLSWNGTSTVYGPVGDFHVGPRITGGSVDPANDPVLVLDEVAVSDVARTEAELRRDAYVGPLVEFEAVWHPQPDHALPTGFAESDVQWPVDVDYSLAKVDLGEELFGDPILSSDGTVSCATCHVEADGFAKFDEPLAPKFGGGELPFNTPTILNSAFGTHKMFDGRAASLEEQVILPLTSGDEMGTQTIQDVVDRLNLNTYYEQEFELVFSDTNPNPVTEERLAEVLAMFERVQLSASSAVDTGTLSSREKEGRAIFFGKGRCFACHTGSAFSDDLFHNIGSVPDIPGNEVEGWGGFTERANEVGRIKTPTLRDLMSTPPYFHDGSKADLGEVIDHYNGGFLSASAKGELDRFLLPIDLSESEEVALEAFLKALSTP